jgi:RNA 3'-terminal phosphate cyclase (ATP)
MLRIDGAAKSGSGTIVRTAVALAALLGEELFLYNIRAKREKSGLRPQHLRAVRAVAELCGGELDGAAVGSMELRFRPGRRLSGGGYVWDIGTAGSTTMLALTVLPVAAFADKPSVFRIRGGLFQDFAPSAFYTQHVLLPALGEMGLAAELEIVRPGYVPKGGGIIELRVEPLPGRLRPLVRTELRGALRFWGISLSSHLRERKVSERMAKRCQTILRRRGIAAPFSILHDETASQPGAALALFAEDAHGARLGADRAGAPRRSAEEIGEAVARMLLEDLDSGATVDRHLADQLIPYAALAEGESRYLIPRVTDHVESNLWLVEEILGASWEIRGNTLAIRGIGYGRG